MIVPPFLPLKKARLAVFSPAGRVNVESLQKGLRFLSAWGFEIEIPPAVWTRCRYLAGDDYERAGLFYRLWMEDFDLLWASRGGYGSLRLLPLLDELLPAAPQAPKWILGFSDVSILLNYLFKRFGLVTLHAPVISSLYETSVCALAALKKCLFRERRLKLSGESWLPGETSGILLGGNLSSLASLLGSPWFPDLRGKILFLEDVNEDLYRLDRLFTQLASAGVFEEIKGLALGDFGGVDLLALKSLVLEYFRGPTLAELPVGHGVHNYPLYIGAPSFLRVGKEGGFLEQAV